MDDRKQTRYGTNEIYSFFRFDCIQNIKMFFRSILILLLKQKAANLLFITEIQQMIVRQNELKDNFFSALIHLIIHK